MDNKVKSDLEKQGYRIVGRHSAIKVCLWCKRALCSKDVCYKNTFYGIQSHRCIQASVSLFNCYHMCTFCWRCLEHTQAHQVINPDPPELILDGLIKEHKEYLQGFQGNKLVTKKMFNEAMAPKHVALSLAGDATLYPYLPNLIELINERKMTSFVVTNGLVPSMVKKLLKTSITQLYITLPAPNKEQYTKVCRPLINDGWERLNESLSLIRQFKRGTIRLTLAKGINMNNAEDYAEIIDKSKPKFVELKAAMPVGYAQYRMAYESMPSHKNILSFAKEICNMTSLKIVDEKENSRVALLMEKDSKDRMLKLL